MAKKKVNVRGREAARRKADAEKSLSKIGLGLKDKLTSIGLVFKHLEISHLTYLGLDSINKFCREHTGVDICIFSQHILQPCLPLLCPVFSIAGLLRWGEQPLISTDIGTTIEALSSNAKTVYHYAFDPEFAYTSGKSDRDICTAFCDPRVRVIVRHESHRALILEEFNSNICDKVVPDCDMEALTKLVLTETDNE